MKMYVNMRIEGCFIAEVEANTPEEAIEKSIDNYYEANFGELTDIDRDVVSVEDENGNFLYEC